MKRNLSRSPFYRSDMEAGCPHRSVQYQRAVKVSFDPNLWRVNEEVAPGPDSLGGCVLVLPDGTRLPSGKPAVSREIRIARLEQTILPCQWPTFPG